MLEHNVQKFINMKIDLILFILWYYFPNTCWLPSVYVKHKSIPWSDDREKSAGVNNNHSLLLHHSVWSVIVKVPFLPRVKAAEWLSCCFGHPSCSQAVKFTTWWARSGWVKRKEVGEHKIPTSILIYQEKGSLRRHILTSVRRERNMTLLSHRQYPLLSIFGSQHFRSVQITRMMITVLRKMISCTCHHPHNSAIHVQFSVTNVIRSNLKYYKCKYCIFPMFNRK